MRTYLTNLYEAVQQISHYLGRVKERFITVIVIHRATYSKLASSSLYQIK